MGEGGVVFQLNDCSCEDRNEQTYLDLYGRTTTGHVSICVHVRWFHCVVLRVLVDSGQVGRIAQALQSADVRIEVQQYHDLVYFQSDVTGKHRRLNPYIECWCRNRRVLANLLGQLMNKFFQEVQVVEREVSPALRFLQQRKLVPSGHVVLTRAHASLSRDATCTLEFDAEAHDLRASPNTQTSVVPWRIQCVEFSSSCISCLNLGDKDGHTDTAFHFRVAAQDPSATLTPNDYIVECKDKDQMLQTWREHVQGMDIDALVLWGPWNQGNQGNQEVTQVTQGSSVHLPFSRCRTWNNLGNNVPGCILIDLHKWLHEHYTLRSSRLSKVAQELLQPTPSCSSLGLLAALVRKTHMTVQMLELSKVCMLFIPDMLQHGALQRGKACLFKHAKDMHFALTPVPSSSSASFSSCSSSSSSFQGGMVLDAKIGLHECVGLVDFARTYPSVIQQHNFCYSSLSAPGDTSNPHLTYHTQQTDQGAFVFQQTHKGVLPTMVANLVQARLDVKAQLKKLSENPEAKANTKENSELAEVLRHREQALKVMANSFYGFTGAHTNANYYLRPLAASITAAARDILTQTRTKLEAQGAEMLYGHTDSLAFSLPLALPSSPPSPSSLALSSLSSAHSLSSLSEFRRVCTQLAAQCSVGLMQLQLEHVLAPMLILGKEQYAGLEDDGHTEVIRGSCQSRNFCSFETNLLRRLLRFVLHSPQSTASEAANDLGPEFARLYSSNSSSCSSVSALTLDELTLSMELGSDYKRPYPPHKLLADRLAERGLAMYRPGERVEFVLTTKGHEDPRWADISHIDRQWYLRHITDALRSVFVAAYGPEPGVRAANQLIGTAQRHLRGERDLSFLLLSKRAKQ